MLREDKCCATCRYGRRLSYNFVIGQGYEKGMCCIRLSDVHADYGVVRQVYPRGICEKYVKKDGRTDYYNNRGS